MGIHHRTTHQDSTGERTGYLSIMHLLDMVITPSWQWLTRKTLQRRLHTLCQRAEYFEWQEANGRTGLAETHKLMAIVQSDLKKLP